MCAICKSYEQLSERPHPAVQPLRFAKGDVIFNEGDRITGVYCLHGGTVALLKHDRTTGNQTTYLATPGDLLGMPGIMIGNVYVNSATALGDVDVRFIPREGFLELIRRQPQLIVQSMRRLCERIGFLEEHLAWAEGEMENPH